MTCSHCCGSGIEPSVLTLDVAHPCGVCGGKGVYPPEWWRDVSHCDANATAAALGAAGEREDAKAMDEQQLPADILGICAMCHKKVLAGSGRMVTYPRLQAVHYLRCETRLRRFLAEAEALAADKMAEAQR